MDGKHITVPLPRSNAALRAEIKEKINNGTYLLGEQIVPKEFTKFVLKADGSIVRVEFSLSGRKIPLLEVRERLMKEHESQGIVRDHGDLKYELMNQQQVRKRLSDIGELSKEDDSKLLAELTDKLRRFERTRHIMLWHDHSSILNHGHLLMTANVIYDSAVFYTSKEMEDKIGYKMDVQQIVESPHIYILARCSDSVADQMAYSETRMEDIREMSTSKIVSSHGAEVVDKPKFFHGDHPATQLEGGGSIGGQYGCMCETQSARFDDIAYSFRAAFLSLEERQLKVSKQSVNIFTEITSKS